MVGLFAINTAIGPLILMIVFLVASVLFHVSLNSAITPLLYCLPKSLEVEEESIQALENSHSGVKDVNAVTTEAGPMSSNGSKDLPAPHKKPNLFTKWLHPEKYTDYQTLRRLVPQDMPEITYSEQIESHAYFNPAIAMPTPLLWIPEDTMGISKQEIAHTSKVTPITDQGASLNDKGKVVWDETTQAPIYDEKIYY